MLEGLDPFLSEDDVIVQVVRNLQRQTHLLPSAVQLEPKFDKALGMLQIRIDNQDSVSSTCLLTYLTLILPSSNKSEAAFSAASTIEFRGTNDSVLQPPTLQVDGPPETAFVAQLRERQLPKSHDYLRCDTLRNNNVRQDHRVDSRQDSVRQDTRVDSRQDNHERRDTRREIRQDYERGIARPEAHHLSNTDPPLS